MVEKNTFQTKSSLFAVILELGGFFIQLTLVVFLLQIFVFQLFLIPSGSMRPTLLVGDYVFVSKYNYGYSKSSFPFSLPLFSGRIFGKSPERGDIAVFKHRDAYSGKIQVYIKRVIGLPNDKLSMRNGTLYINDKPVERSKLGVLDNADYTGVARPVDVYQETLPNGVTYHTLALDPDGLGNNFQSLIVPDGMYFMMGDNRDDSEDSRFSLGFLSFEDFVGKARFLFFSIGNNSKAYMLWRWPFDVRWSRFFTSVNEMKTLPGIKVD